MDTTAVFNMIIGATVIQAGCYYTAAESQGLSMEKLLTCRTTGAIQRAQQASCG